MKGGHLYTDAQIFPTLIILSKSLSQPSHETHFGIRFPPIFFIVAFTSCSKTGPTGATAPAGPIGDTGIANVTYSSWISAGNSRDSTIDGSLVVVETLPAASFTATGLKKAGIQVFFTIGAGGFPLPDTFYAGGKVSTISFIPEAGQILITRFTGDDSASAGYGRRSLGS